MFELSTIDSAGAFPVGSKNEDVPPGATSITPLSIESAASPNSASDYEGADTTGSSFQYNHATNDDTNSVGDDNGSYSGHSWYAAGATATMMEDHSDSASDASSVRSINSWRSLKSGRSQNTTRSPSGKSSKSSASSSRRNRSASPSSRKRSFLKKKNRTTTSSTLSMCSTGGDEDDKENNEAAAASASQKHPLYDKVKSLIERVMPNETNSVDEMMLQFEGREDELIMTLEAMVVDDTPPKKSMTKGKRPLKSWVSKKKQTNQNNKQLLSKRGGPGGTPPKPPPKKPPLPPSAKKSKRPGFPPRGKASPRKPPLSHARQPKSPNTASAAGNAIAALSSSSHTNSSRLTFSDDKSFFSAAESLTEIHVPTATAKEATSPRTQEENARQEIVTDLEHFIERGNWDAVRDRAADVDIKADLEEEIEDVLSNATTLTSNSSMSQNMRLELVSPAHGSDQEFTAEMERFVENNDWAGVVDAVKRLENRLSQVQQENDALKRGESSVVSERTIAKICDAVTPPPPLNDSSNVSVASIISGANSRNSSVGGDTLHRLFSTGSVSSDQQGESVTSRSTKDASAVVESNGSPSRGKQSSSSLSPTPKTKDKSVLSGVYGSSDGSSSGSGVLDMFFAQQEVAPLSPENGLDLVFHHKDGHSPMSLLTTDEDRTSSLKELGNKKDRTNPVVPEPIEEVEEERTASVPPVAGPNDNAFIAPAQDECIRDLDSKLALAESKLSSALPSGLQSGNDDSSESSKENDDELSIEIARLDSVTDVLRNELELFEASETNMLEELEQERSPTGETGEEVSGTTTTLKSSEARSFTAMSRDESSFRETKAEVPLEDALEMVFQETVPDAGDENTIASSSTKSAIVIQNQGITKEFHIIEDTQEGGGEVYESFNDDCNDESEDDDELQQQESYVLTMKERTLLGLVKDNTQLDDTTNGINNEGIKDIVKIPEETHPSSPDEVRNTLLQITETQKHTSVEKTVTKENTESTDAKQEDKIDAVNETIEVKQVVHSPPPPPTQVKPKAPQQQPKADTGCACIIL